MIRGGKSRLHRAWGWGATSEAQAMVLNIRKDIWTEGEMTSSESSSDELFSKPSGMKRE